MLNFMLGFIFGVVFISALVLIGDKLLRKGDLYESEEDYVNHELGTTDEKGFDPLMTFHKQLQVECPEGHARVGELCDLPGVWICVERFKEVEIAAWLDEPYYDVELGIDESLNYIGDGTWEEVEIQNDCGHGCKIYQHTRTGRRTLAHNSAYGCKRSFNLIKE